MPAAKKTASFHAVAGSDEFEIKRVAKELADTLNPGGDFGLEIIDGAAGVVDEAVRAIHSTLDALQTFGMFAGQKLVWLKNATFLADTPVGRSETVLEGLEKLSAILQGGLPDGTRFLLSATPVDKRRSFFKSLPKLGEVQVFDSLDNSKSGWEDAAGEVVASLSRKRGLGFEDDARELFILYTGGDRRTIEGEVEKIDLYLGPERRTATVEDVRLLTPLSKEGVIFELGNAIAERSVSRAMDLLKQLIFQGENEVGILLVAVIPTVRNLLLVKDLMTRHKLQRPAQPFFFGKTLERLPAAALAHLPRTKEGKLNAFPLGIAAQNAHRYQLPELRQALTACLEANVALVSAATEKEVILSQLIVKLVANRS